VLRPPPPARTLSVWRCCEGDGSFDSFIGSRGRRKEHFWLGPPPVVAIAVAATAAIAVVAVAAVAAARRRVLGEVRVNSLLLYGE
jgi:hypothetical protein